MALTGALSAIAVAGGVVNTIQTADAQGAAQKQFDVERKKEQDLINQAKAKEEESKKNQEKINKRNFQEQEQVSKAFDSNKTIFSGSLGVPTAPGGTKTLLGS